MEDGHPVSLGGGKQRAVLALLLLNANRIVSSDGLIDQLWNGQPPATAGTALQGHISSLRKALGADVIATRRPGYVLEADPAQIDLARFEQLRGEARRALERGDAGAGADKLREALGLWRGEALADIGFEPSIQAEAARLEDLRLAALEDRIDAELAVGRSADLVDELERLVAANPLREHLWGQLMLALYRWGARRTRSTPTVVPGRRSSRSSASSRDRRCESSNARCWRRTRLSILSRSRSRALGARHRGVDLCCSRRRARWSWVSPP